jgi:hypothetical protein
VAAEHEWQRRRHEWSLRSDADDLHRIDDDGIPQALLVQRRRAALMPTQYCPDAIETCFRYAMPVPLTNRFDTAEGASRAVLWCSQGAALPHLE